MKSKKIIHRRLASKLSFRVIFSVRKRIFFEHVTPLLLVTLAPWCTGCASGICTTQATTTSAGNGGGALQVRVYERNSDRKKDHEAQRRIVSELYRIEGHEQKLVREETAARWLVSDLPPGQYQLRVAKWMDDAGRTLNLGTIRKEKFLVSSGQTTTADVVIHTSKSGWYVLAAAAVALAVCVASCHPLGSGSFFDSGP